jgi:hypothetical protein
VGVPCWDAWVTARSCPAGFPGVRSTARRCRRTWLVDGVWFVAVGDLDAGLNAGGDAGKQADRGGGQQGGSERGRLGHGCALDDAPGDVGLDLVPHVALGAAAEHANGADGDAHVLDNFEVAPDDEGDGLEGRTGEMRFGVVGGEPEEDALGLRVDVGRHGALQMRQHNEAVRARRHSFGLCGEQVVGVGCGVRA